ncbi:MAG: redox-regulated ATPase YchF [Anaerolineae bacterium]|nr:redox-regulated ATPase YchF [Anaerolineae bacterium]
MSLQLGLVGLPNVGKSTLFNALTNAGATVANYPFTTIDPNVGVVPVPDARLGRLGAIVNPERLVPTTLRIVDIAGLVKGASHGEGLGNQFLSHIRGVDAMVMVVRCFENLDVAHVTPELDPVEDIETVDLELVLSDLTILERHYEKVQSLAKANPREHREEAEVIARAVDALRAGTAIRDMELKPEQRSYLAGIPLLTAMPRLYVANVSEDDLPDGGTYAEQVRIYAQRDGTPTVVLCAKLEAELNELPPEDASQYLASCGLSRPGLDRMITTGYGLLRLITFFTMTGGKEVRAWTLQRGQTALEAAATVHTDMARGFIRAEVVAFDDLDRLGSIAAAREAGKVRLEGRDYVVRDGDVIHIRFAV